MGKRRHEGEEAVRKLCKARKITNFGGEINKKKRKENESTQCS